MPVSPDQQTDTAREVNGITVLHKRPDEISQILVRAVREPGVRWFFRDPEQGASFAFCRGP